MDEIQLVSARNDCEDQSNIVVKPVSGGSSASDDDKSAIASPNGISGNLLRKDVDECGMADCDNRANREDGNAHIRHVKNRALSGAGEVSNVGLEDLVSTLVHSLSKPNLKKLALCLGTRVGGSKKIMAAPILLNLLHRINVKEDVDKNLSSFKVWIRHSNCTRFSDQRRTGCHCYASKRHSIHKVGTKG